MSRFIFILLFSLLISSGYSISQKELLIYHIEPFNNNVSVQMSQTFLSNLQRIDGLKKYKITMINVTNAYLSKKALYALYQEKYKLIKNDRSKNILLYQTDIVSNIVIQGDGIASSHTSSRSVDYKGLSGTYTYTHTQGRTYLEKAIGYDYKIHFLFLEGKNIVYKKYLGRSFKNHDIGIAQKNFVNEVLAKVFQTLQNNTLLQKDLIVEDVDKKKIMFMNVYDPTINVGDTFWSQDKKSRLIIDFKDEQMIKGRKLYGNFQKGELTLGLDTKKQSWNILLLPYNKVGVATPDQFTLSDSFTNYNKSISLLSEYNVFLFGIANEYAINNNLSIDLGLRFGITDINQYEFYAGMKYAYSLSRIFLQCGFDLRLQRDDYYLGRIEFGEISAGIPNKFYVGDTEVVSYADVRYQQYFFGVSPKLSIGLHLSRRLDLVFDIHYNIWLLEKQVFKLQNSDLVLRNSGLEDQSYFSLNNSQIPDPLFNNATIDAGIYLRIR